MTLTRLGEVITFYSYKGGTGRSMALSNIACLFAKRRSEARGALVIDWDLEAPGLHRFFYNDLQRAFISREDPARALDEHPGLIDLFLELEALGLTRLHGPIRVKRSCSVKGVEKMGKRGKLYSPEFKEEAVRLVHSSEQRYPVAKIARDLDISTETLRKWVNQAQIDAGERDGLTTEEKEELHRLRKEVKVLKQEREILKKRQRSSPGRRTSERAGDLQLHRNAQDEPPDQ